MRAAEVEGGLNWSVVQTDPLPNAANDQGREDSDQDPLLACAHFLMVIDRFRAAKGDNCLRMDRVSNRVPTKDTHDQVIRDTRFDELLD